MIYNSASDNELGTNDSQMSQSLSVEKMKNPPYCTPTSQTGTRIYFKMVRGTKRKAVQSKIPLFT